MVGEGGLDRCVAINERGGAIRITIRRDALRSQSRTALAKISSNLSSLWHPSCGNGRRAFQSIDPCRAARSPRTRGVGDSFQPARLVAFSASLILASGALVFTLMRTLNHDFRARLLRWSLVQPARDAAPTTTPAWGELLTSDVQLENPEEYLATDFDTSRPPTRVFDRLSLDQVRALLRDCGLSAALTDHALAPAASPQLRPIR